MQKERRSHRDTFTKYSKVTEAPEIGRDNCYGRATQAIGKTKTQIIIVIIGCTKKDKIGWSDFYLFICLFVCLVFLIRKKCTYLVVLKFGDKVKSNTIILLMVTWFITQQKCLSGIFYEKL